MKFLWPHFLWLLLALPALAALYLCLLRRKRQAALRYGSLTLVPGARGLHRHAPPLLFLLALTAMIVAVARPTAVVTVPSLQQTILLVMDVSGSMRATDVKPNRLAAAQEAAKAFVAALPRQVRVGVVSFAATASLVQPPTRKREDVYAAIDRFQLQRGTAIGSGIIVALATLFPEAGIEVIALEDGGEEKARKRDKTPPVEPGSDDSAAIVLLTDGQRTTGPDTLAAARLAAEHGVRVYTVGIGTATGETIAFDGWSMRVRLDEDTLKAIALTTRGEYSHAATAQELKQIYQTLTTRLTLQQEEMEISAFFAAAGTILALAAAALSLLWFSRVL
ncbi:MAG TPA: VWA domain-containing protein [Candidatus Competibacteraceae bacterium]|nr:VWA domain-containing protein [Candidatus Competibacteraceae bacterium]